MSDNKILDKTINDMCELNGFSHNQNLLNMFGNFVVTNNFKMRSSNEVAECVNKFLERDNVDSIHFSGSKNDLPPKGYVRIIGAENKSEWNELVKLEYIDERIKNIIADYPHEDSYYTDLKFFWLKYEDGKEEQLCNRAWK